MRGEADLVGVFVPGLLCAAMIAYLFSTVLRRLLSWAGAYRFIWHPPLFDLALYVVVLAIVVWGGREAGWQ
jgi:hypothetical protein